MSTAKSLNKPLEYHPFAEDWVLLTTNNKDRWWWFNEKTGSIDYTNIPNLLHKPQEGGSDWGNFGRYMMDLGDEFEYYSAPEQYAPSFYANMRAFNPDLLEWTYEKYPQIADVEAINTELAFAGLTQGSTTTPRSRGSSSGRSSGTSPGMSEMLQFLQAVPAARDFLDQYYPFITQQMLKTPESPPMALEVAGHPMEEELIQRQRGRLDQIPDIEQAYKGAFESYLPMMQRQYETSVKETESRLESLGLAGSSPGQELLGDMALEHGANIAGLKKDIDLQIADASRSMYDMEGTQMAALWDMVQTPTARGAENLRLQYGDWLRQQGQPVETASLLGTPSSQSMLGAMSNIYQQGLSSAAQRYSAAQSASASRYASNMGMAQTQWEAQFMAPYLQQANQPVEIPSSSVCCFIFLEARYANGAMDRVVRRFRDERMTARNRRGYYKLAEVLVPLMRRSRVAKALVRVLMTDPMVSYGRYYYGEGRIGRIFAPVAKAWLKLYDYLGGDFPFVRENGELV